VRCAPAMSARIGEERKLYTNKLKEPKNKNKKTSKNPAKNRAKNEENH